MKANELMVGDWVEYNGKHYQVMGTNAVGNSIDIKEDDGPFGYVSDSSDRFSFIPLTAEILERNGFESNADHAFALYEYLKDECSVQVWFDDEDSGVSVFNHNYRTPRNVVEKLRGAVELHKCGVRAVHELQHMLRIAEINDLADNFKI